MKRTILSSVLALGFLILGSASISAQTPKDVKYVYTDAQSLTHIGKLCTDTPNPYHRVDTVRFKGFTKGENDQMRSRLCQILSAAA